MPPRLTLTETQPSFLSSCDEPDRHSVADTSSISERVRYVVPYPHHRATVFASRPRTSNPPAV